ncbi:MAG: hypothetical protein H0X37_08725 [Herpetosiphonaceae bacterium]|nr:hypothetical protein [Herpetosiphonaceae bacterium]
MFCQWVTAVAAKTTMLGADFQNEQRLMVVASGAALLVLLVLTALSVYKPQGMTRYGQRKQYELQQGTGVLHLDAQE